MDPSPPHIPARNGVQSSAPVLRDELRIGLPPTRTRIDAAVSSSVLTPADNSASDDSSSQSSPSAQATTDDRTPHTEDQAPVHEKHLRPYDPRVPVAVREAIRAFRSPDGLVVVPQRRGESSLIFAWGARVADRSSTTRMSWFCLASEDCRTRQTQISMSQRKTSKATHHLKSVHGRTSEKTEIEQARKRDREDAVAALGDSELFRTNPARLCVILEVMRIVNNHLPFRLGEYEESLLLNKLSVKEEMRASINAHRVTHTIVELYAATRREITSILAENRVGNGRSFSIVADFWTSKPQATKYLGIRIYFVDKNFEYRSVLLGVRHFKPKYADRVNGIRGPFLRWIQAILKDFGLSTLDLFGATTDSGPDVKWMLRTGLSLQWEWCIPHMTNATTKAACGDNPALMELVKNIVKTVYQVRQVEVLGDLFREICSELYEDGPQQLTAYAQHRFMGLSRVVGGRILELWDAIAIWYLGRQTNAVASDRTVSPFQLEGCRLELEQVFSLLKPIANINRRSQAESSNQVEVFATLIALRRSVLNCGVRLKHYRSTIINPMNIEPGELTPTAALLRKNLRQRFDEKFFFRYTHPQKLSTRAFTWEMQLLLHPKLKRSLDTGFREVVLMCTRDAGHTPDLAERNFQFVKDTVRQKLIGIMVSIHTNRVDTDTAPHVAPVYSEDIEDITRTTEDVEAEGDDPVYHQDTDIHDIMRMGQCAEELSNWLADGSELAVGANNRPESILAFWLANSATICISDCALLLEFCLQFRHQQHKSSAISASQA